jgi:hypothetical protein
MCSILTPRFLSTRVVFHCFLNGIMNVLFMDIANIMAWSTGLLALIHLLLAQDILQSLGDSSRPLPMYRCHHLPDRKGYDYGDDQQRKNTLNM